MSWLQQEDDTTPCSKVRRNRAKITARSLPNWILLKPDSVHLLSNKSVVGYSQTQLGQNFTAGGAQFIPVSGSTIDLNQLSVTGYEEVSADEVYVQVLDSLGRGGVNYVWIDSPEDEALGWINTDTGDFAEDGELTIAPGAGIWVNAPSADFVIEMPGVNLK